MANRWRLTKSEWNTCEDPQLLLGSLSLRALGLRSLTHFACACCKRINRLLPSASCLLDATSAWIDGQAEKADVDLIRQDIVSRWPAPTSQELANLAAYAVYFASFDADDAREFQATHHWAGETNYRNLLTFFKDCSALYAAQAFALKRSKRPLTQAKICARERAAQAELLRDVFRGP